MLKKRTVRITKMATEIMPPVVEVYSVYPLYLTRLLEEKKSMLLNALLIVERQGILDLEFNLNL